MTTNELQSLATKAKLANIGIIILTLLAYLGLKITDAIGEYFLQDDLLSIYQVLSILFAIISGYLFWKMKDTSLKGGILLLIASIVSFIFSMLGMMLGLIIWILCGVSIRQLNSSVQELDFISLPKITPLDTADQKNDSFSGFGFNKNDTES